MWQQIYQEVGGPDFELLAVAIDPSGPDAARPFLDAAGATFPSFVDASGRTSAILGFKVVPNGILVDEAGTIRYRKDGGFSNANAADLEAVRRFARGGDAGPSPAPRLAPYALSAIEADLVASKMKLGRLLDTLGRRDEALAQWTAALHRDPENLTIRKAIWAARFPERFHPTIDSEWQLAQREVERAEELAAGFCGPDGCPLG